MKESVKKATKFKQVSLNLTSSIIRIRIRKYDLLPAVGHPPDRTNTVSQVSKEEPESLSLSSSCQAFLVRVINMTQLCNSSIKILRVHDSQTTLSKAITMLAVFKTRNQIVLQMEWSSQKALKTADPDKIKTDRTNTTSILKERLPLRATARMAEWSRLAAASLEVRTVNRCKIRALPQTTSAATEAWTLNLGWAITTWPGQMQTTKMMMILQTTTTSMRSHQTWEFTQNSWRTCQVSKLLIPWDTELRLCVCT